MRSLLLLALLGGVAHADRFEVLVNRIEAMPDVQGPVRPAVQAALQAERPQDGITAELLLAIAYPESRYDPYAGPACGIAQVYPRDIDEPASNCRVWPTMPDLGFEAAVTELQMLLADRRVHGDMHKALLYRACGGSAFTGKCRKGGYPSAVLNLAKKLTW